MTRHEPVHDLGGRTGYGPVPVHDDVIFHADWERRAFGVSQFSQGLAGFNTDAFRYGIEREPAEVYDNVTYFDKWIRNAERMLVEGGVLAPDAVPARIGGRVAVGPVARTTDAEPPLSRGARRQVETAPRFALGDRVVVTAPVPAPGHTRCPSYVVGHVGVVELVNDAWVFPDSHAHGRGERPCWVYAVGFDAAELWPADGASHTVVVDLFEPYLSAATEV